MNDKTYTVVLVLQSGGAFRFRDVELLAFHLHKQWYGKRRLRILCLFNEIETPCKLIDVTLIPMSNKEWKKWWCKMNLFSPDMEQYRPFLFIDLDTAIVGDLKGVLPPVGREDQFITLGGFNGRAKYLLSGMMWFPTKNSMVSEIWEQWIADPKIAIQKSSQGDQGFIKKVIKNPDERWQNITDKIYNFKPRDGVTTQGKNWHQRVLKNLPKEASIVCFHGKPKIFDAAEQVDWVKKYINNI